MPLAKNTVYSEKALSSLPRILGNMDRNPFSRTYGCIHRDYWLEKVSDFPDAVRQFGVHAMALAWHHSMPKNPYHQHPKVLEWIIAALDFWASIQHEDGSFDEFYPYERGWVGPTAFTAYTCCEAYKLVQEHVSDKSRLHIEFALQKAARFIARGQSEEDHLANHWAMACLAVWKIKDLFQMPELYLPYEKLWQTFLTYHNQEEGWSREYDGIDPGYLSATVSFLAKIYRENRDPRLAEVINQSIETCAYFAYPNGFYAGSAGSRNTLHFYPHGFEIMAAENPLAAAVAEKMLVALRQDKLVPPQIMSDRYLVYRVPEYLLSYLDHYRPEKLPKLPYEKADFQTYLPQARIWVRKRKDSYIVANLAKGGVVKLFNAPKGYSLLSDCGVLGKLKSGEVATNQWIDSAYRIESGKSGFSVEGRLHQVVASKLFTPVKNIAFRGVMTLLGPIPVFCHWFKGYIRKTLIMNQPRLPIAFKREVKLVKDEMIIKDTITPSPESVFSELKIGGEFFVRYVPQSMYFQAQELEVPAAYSLSKEQLEKLKREGSLTLERRVDLSAKAESKDDIGFHDREDSLDPLAPADQPMGVLDREYSDGRESKPELQFRLQTRAAILANMIKKYYWNSKGLSILDFGSAEGKTLMALDRALPGNRIQGLEYSGELIGLAQALPQNVELMEGDITDPSACLKRGAYDVVSALAVLEHLSDPQQGFDAAYKMLKPRGLLIATCPVPAWDQISSRLGLLKDDQHEVEMNRQRMIQMLQNSGFELLDFHKFMWAPLSFLPYLKVPLSGPMSLNLDRAVASLKIFDCLFVNQIIVGRKPAA